MILNVTSNSKTYLDYNKDGYELFELKQLSQEKESLPRSVGYESLYLGLFQQWWSLAHANHEKSRQQILIRETTDSHININLRILRTHCSFPTAKLFFTLN